MDPKENLPKISVVIPLFNKEKTIESCLQSVLRQSSKADEILVIDDGSTDNSLVIIQGLIDKMGPGSFDVYSQKNQGVSVARNRGCEISRYEYIAFLDADDEWDAEFLVEMRKLITEFNEAVMFCCSHKIMDSNLGALTPTSPVSKGHRGYLQSIFKSSTKNPVATPSKSVYKKSAFQEIGGFPTEAVIGEDIYVWIMLALHGKVAYFNKYLVTIKQEPDQSRLAREGLVPYPLEFFSLPDNHKLLKRNEGLADYLWQVFFLHFFGSLTTGNKREAILRLKNGYKVFGFKALALGPALLLPSKLISSIRNKRRSGWKTALQQ